VVSCWLVIDRVFKGAGPAELPVEKVDTFRLRFNQNTAHAIYIGVPPVLLSQANEVMQQ